MANALSGRIEREHRNEGRRPQRRPVPTDAMNSQPKRIGSRRRAGPREMAHADPCAEQAHRARDGENQLMIGGGDGQRVAPEYAPMLE